MIFFINIIKLLCKAKYKYHWIDMYEDCDIQCCSHFKYQWLQER